MISDLFSEKIEGFRSDINWWLIVLQVQNLWSVLDNNECFIEINAIYDQKPSLLLSLDLSTYSWMCSDGTGYSTTSRTLKEAYLEGSKSLGWACKAPFLARQASTSWSWIWWVVPVFACRSQRRWQYGQKMG